MPNENRNKKRIKKHTTKNSSSLNNSKDLIFTYDVNEFVIKYLKKNQPPNTLEDAEDIFNIAFFCYQQDKSYELAIQVFKTIQHFFNEEPDFYAAIGNCYYRLYQYKEALENFEMADQLKSKDPQIFNFIGAIHLYDNNNVDAVTAFTKAINLDAKNALFYYNRGLARARFGEYDFAIKDFNAAISIDKTQAQFYISLIEIKLQLKKFPEVIANAETALQIHQNEILRFMMAIAQISTQQFEVGLLNFKTCLYDMDMLFYDEAIEMYSTLEFTEKLAASEIDEADKFSKIHAIYNKYLKLYEAKITKPLKLPLDLPFIIKIYLNDIDILQKKFIDLLKSDEIYPEDLTHSASLIFYDKGMKYLNCGKFTFNYYQNNDEDERIKLLARNLLAESIHLLKKSFKSGKAINLYLGLAHLLVHQLSPPSEEQKSALAIAIRYFKSAINEHENIYFEEARAYLVKNEYKNALNSMGEFLASSPSSETFGAMAQIDFQQKNYLSAIEKFSILLKNPTNQKYQHYLLRGLAYLELKNFPLGNQDLQTAYLLNADEALANLTEYKKMLADHEFPDPDTESSLIPSFDSNYVLEAYKTYLPDKYNFWDDSYELKSQQEIQEEKTEEQIEEKDNICPGIP